MTMQKRLKYCVCELEVENQRLAMCTLFFLEQKRPLGYHAQTWLYAEQRPEPFSPAVEATTRPTMRPYKPKASAKMRMRIMPTKRRGCCALALTPASPTMPMARPAAREERPTVRPAPRWA